MVAKKLYSLRIEPKLLEALRRRADLEGITVSELMHRLLSEALDLREEVSDKQTINSQDLASWMSKVKDEIKEELKNEMLASFNSSDTDS